VTASHRVPGCRVRAGEPIERAPTTVSHDVTFGSAIIVSRAILHGEYSRTTWRPAVRCNMRAIRVHNFGGLDSLVVEDVPRPAPGEGEVLLRVKAAGVGPWDALVRSGRSVVPQPLPLTLGSDVSGLVEEIGAGVSQFQAGDAVFGATNARFTGGYAEYTVASATKLAKMPQRLGFIEAASVPVVACTAWQMVFEYGAVDATKRVLVHGAAGNVGAYAVQLAKRVAHEVIATTSSDDVAYVQALGADRVVDVKKSRFEEVLTEVDVVLDTIGGATQD
jgi:NADPH:quinone reductase-like Zn-dependent oxidoreductase